jgi:hypothetical protein
MAARGNSVASRLRVLAVGALALLAAGAASWSVFAALAKTPHCLREGARP